MIKSKNMTIFALYVNIQLVDSHSSYGIDDSQNEI